MKYLIIDNSRAFFTVDKSASVLKPIDQITKEDLMKLLDLCVTEEFEMDPYDPQKLKNAAHQIIYKNIYQKLDNLITQRERFEDEKTALYFKAIADYSVELLAEDSTSG